MRDFSRLGLKLLGILLVYWALSALCRALSEIPLLFIQWTPADKAALMNALRREGLVSEIVQCVISGAFAAIVLGRTDWIILKFKLPEEPEIPSIMPPGELLRVCLIVVGFVAMIYGFPGLPKILAWALVLTHESIFSGMPPDKYGFVATGEALELNLICDSIASTVQFVLGWVLVLKSRTLASKALGL